jgi:dipeptidyl aminopeptidase/acylaminoacyl peptidase
MKHWQWRAAIVALVLLAPGCSDERVTGPGEDPDAVWDLMFHATSGNLSEILVVPPNTGGFPERLFPVGRFAMQAVGSPDGSRIAYVVRDPDDATRIYVADRAGGNARRVGRDDGGDGWPAWSPDGNRLAFQSGPVADIYVVNADGSGLTRVTTIRCPR